VRVVTQARTADDLLGRNIAGSWEDEEIVLPVIERVGQAKPYGDTTAVKLSSFNTNYEKRTVVRFEDGLEVTTLEEARAAKAGVNSALEKRAAVTESLAISLNSIAFNGYNNGANKTYGVLNDPNLSAYVTVEDGAAGDPEWSSKTFIEIINDVKTAMSALRVQSGYNFNPEKDSATLAIAASVVDFLATPNELGTISVKRWLNDTYPNLKIVAVPEFSGANGGANVFYIFADKVSDNSVLGQYVQSVLTLVGVEKKAKGFIESYTNATAGVLVSSPIGVVRYTGI
jgi:hypothetical protein